jgi:hypothetical protein
MSSILNRFSVKQWMLLAALPMLWCALMNQGFFASDEYWTGITRYIPAQTSTVENLIEPDAVKSPSQLMPFYLLAKLALKMNITGGYGQYVFLLSIVGVFSTALLLFSFYRLPGESEDKKIGLLLLGFHFATAISFTRPMFESASAPWVALAGLCALLYDQSPKTKYLMLGVFAASVAFLLRPQAGAVALTFIAMPMWKQRWKDLIQVLCAGVLSFVLTGFLDQALMGEFHGSLKKVLFYNIKHGAEYGAQPFYYFFPLLFVLAFGFWTIKSFWSPEVRRSIWKMKSLLFMLGIFVFIHSLFANKFERFLIPILPILLMLIVPAVKDVFLSSTVSSFRRWSFIGINAVLFFTTTFFEPQGPIIELARFANTKTDLQNYLSYKEAVHWYPEVFLSRPVGLQQVTELSGKISCQQVLVARASEVDDILGGQSDLVILKQVSPGPVDWLAYRLNPQHNQRRAPLVLLGCPAYL